MKRLFLILFACVFVFWAGTASAVLYNINIQTLSTPPTGSYTDITNLDWISVPNGSNPTFHVGIPGGIWDLHISVPAGQVPPPFTVTQNLFPNLQINGLTADMWGKNIPFCTYFTITNDVSFDIKATVPIPAGLLLFGSGLVGLIGLGRKRLFWNR